MMDSTESDVKDVEFYTIRELRFTQRQMLWITRNLYNIRLADWPVEPDNHVEIISPSKGKRQLPHKTLKTRSARFERAAQIAAEIDWRLNQCKTKHGDYGLLYLEVYMYGHDISEVAKRHSLSEDVVNHRIDQVLRYISGWRRKSLNMEQYNQHRVKGYKRRVTRELY